MLAVMLTMSWWLAPAAAEPFAGAALPPGWVTWRGAWRVQDGALLQTDRTTGGAYAWATAQAYGDGEVRVRFNSHAGGPGVRAAGVVCRAADNRTGYYVHCDVRNQQVILVRQSPAKPWHELARRRGVRLPTDAWVTAVVSFRGPEFAVAIDGQVVLTARDEAYTAGYVGLRAGQGEIAFDDFTVTGEPVAREAFQVLSDPNDWNDLARVTDRTDHLAAAADGGYFPVLVTLDDGSLGAVIRGGAPHIGRAGRLDWIRSTDGGRTWSAPVVVVDSAWDDRNPAAGVMPNGDVVCAYGEARSYDAEGRFNRAAGPYLPKFVVSRDRGATWSAARDLAPDWYGVGSPYGRIIVLPDGTALCSMYTWPPAAGQPAGFKLQTAARFAAGVVRSTDGGRTWGDGSLIAEGYNETALAATADGRLLAALRDDAGAVWCAASTDGGRTWDKPVPVTPPAIHPADLLPLDGQTVLMVCGCRQEVKGVVALLSDDGGRTFPAGRRAFVAWDALSGDCGYPSVQRQRDGSLVVVWYAVGTAQQAGAQARCVRFTEAALRAAAGPR